MDYALPEQPDKVKYTFFLLSAEQGLAYEQSPLAKTGTKFWPKWWPRSIRRTGERPACG